MLKNKTKLVLFLVGLQLSLAGASYLKWSSDVGEPAPTLRQVLLIHRHGDRAPMTFPENDILKDDPLWKLYGYGQLTNKGKQRVYQMGKMTRQRYDQFMLGSVDKNDRFTRTSQVKRCVESAELFLAAFLGPNTADLVWDNSSLGQLWQPASMASVPEKIDGMLASGAECKAMDKEVDKINQSKEFHKLLQDYHVEFKLLEETYKIQIKSLWDVTDTLDTVLVETLLVPEKLPAKIMAIKERLVEANSKAFGFLQSTMKARRLQAGLLMTDLVNNLVAIPKMDPTVKKFIHYSTHDTIITVLLGMLESWQNQQPGNAANVAIELHQDVVEGDQWFVRIFYMNKVPGELRELRLTSCERQVENGAPRCSLEDFQQMMKPYLFENWEQWMSECGNDLTNIHPYNLGS